MPHVEPLPTTSRLIELAATMSDRPVLMLVDLVADRFITGAPKRISREAPVLILRFEGETFVPGGGANAVANVAALGGRPLPVGIVGDDHNGGALLDALRAMDVPTEGIFERPGYPTPTKTRILAGGKHSIKQQVVRFDVEQAVALNAAERRLFEEKIAAWKGEARVCVLSDYGYGAVQPDLLPAVRGNLAADSIVLCDSRYRLSGFSGIDGATPNEEEAEALSGERFNDDYERIEEAGRALGAKLGTSFLLVTRGSRGMTLFDSGAACHIPIHGTDQVADVTGAGDTVIGTFALALAAGGTPLEAALLANYAGGIVVSKLGTATLTREELTDHMASDTTLVRNLRWARF